MQTLPLSKKLLLLSGSLFVSFLVCQASYKAIGQHIDKDGTLREAFFLIPTSALLLLGSTVTLAGAAVVGLKTGP